MASTQGSNLGIYHTWAFAENGWNTQMDTNLKLLDLVVMMEVLSATTTAQPGSPSAGDRYIIPTSATGADWSGQDGDIGLYDGSAWSFYTPEEGWEVRADDTKQRWVYNSSAWALEGSLFGQYADDTAASAGGVPVGGAYVDSSSGSLQIRLS